jgi:Flp pilus assembly protein TadG
MSKGSVIIETALIFSAFAVMLIGLFDFGQFLFVHQALVERARYSARWGAINDPSDTTSITNMVLYNQAATPPSGTASYFNLTPSMVQVTSHDSGTDHYRLVLEVSGYPYMMLSPFIGGTHTGRLISVSVPLGLFN